MYLVASQDLLTCAGNCFRELLRRPEILRIPGAHNGLSALQAKAAGFEALYVSGAAMSASMGIPDLGLLTIEDVCFFVRQIVRASNLPVLVDGDTGFGEALNVMHTVRCFEDAGAAAIQIEDQVLPKKCGHLNNKRLVAPEEMAAKIAAAAQARRHLYIIARTDAVQSEGVEGAIARAKLYLEAGADAIFPEALTSAEMFHEFAKSIDAPLLANMTEFGRTPSMSGRDFEQLGYRMVIWPVSSLRVAARAQEKLYGTLRAHDSVEGMLPEMQTRDELYSLIGYHGFEQLDTKIINSLAREAPALRSIP